MSTVETKASSQNCKLCSQVATFPTRLPNKGGRKQPRQQCEATIDDLLNEVPSASFLSALFRSAESAAYFKSNYFRRQPVHCPGADIEYLIQALQELNVLELVRNTSSDQIHVWIPRMDSSSLDSISLDDAEQAYKLYMAGHSLYCRAPQHIEEAFVMKALDDLNFGVIGSSDRFRRGEVEMFFSRKGHFTDFHADFQENFTIQIQGVKEWVFVDSTACHPIRGCTPHFGDEKERDVAEQQLKVLRLGDPSFSPNQFKIGEKSSIVLNPGDILYHPAGIWHRVNCLEDSISINVSLTGASYAEIFCSSLQQLLWENPSWRSVASSNPLEAHSTMQSLLSNLPEVLRNICPADLLPAPVFNTNKPADEQAPSSSSQDENSDEESEAEDSEAEEETNIIDVEACSIEDLLELLPLIPTTGKRSKSTERSLPAIADIKFRINPLAMVVNVEQFSEQSSANDSSCSQVHCGYGNETLESLCRSTVRVPKRLELAWSKLISLSEQARSRRIQSLQSTKPSDRVGEEVAISDLKQAKSSDSDLEKLLIAASLAGLLSIAPRK